MIDIVHRIAGRCSLVLPADNTVPQRGRLPKVVKLCKMAKTGGGVLRFCWEGGGGANNLGQTNKGKSEEVCIRLRRNPFVAISPKNIVDPKKGICTMYEYTLCLQLYFMLQQCIIWCMMYDEARKEVKWKIYSILWGDIPALQWLVRSTDQP